MRVKTKYGLGTLLGMCLNGDNTSYKVLLDNLFPSELFEEEREQNEIKKAEDRIYNCLSVTVLTDDGQEIVLGKRDKMWTDVKTDTPAHKDLVLFKNSKGLVMPAIYFDNDSFSGFYPYTTYYHSNDLQCEPYKEVKYTKFEDIVSWKLIQH